MKLTREEALKYHRQMWSDMQKELGDNPRSIDRSDFKRRWCEEHFPEECVESNCFLCAYDDCHGYEACEFCPIDWPYKDEHGNPNCSRESKTNWHSSPISEILALPEREVEDGTDT